jgi:hypothetical protein
MGRKAQWFIVSAVIITTSLVSISVIFKNYFLMDNSDIAKLNEDYLALDLENQFNKIIGDNGYDQPSCAVLTSKINDFIVFYQQAVAERGRLLKVTYNINCAGRTTTFNVVVASDKMSVSRSITI